MSPKVQIVSTDANVKSVEFGGVVTVGHPDTAAKYSKLLGRKVVVGDQIDLGTIATYNQNPFRNFVNNLKMKFQKVRIISGP